jgi:hypothetical protein
MKIPQALEKERLLILEASTRYSVASFFWGVGVVQSTQLINPTHRACTP